VILKSHDKLKIGIIGCGAFGESHLKAFSAIANAEVVAVTDRVEERARKLAEIYKVPHVPKDFDELCGLDSLHAVSVVTTEDQHLEPVLAACANRKHVFVEKPLATSVVESERMIGAAKDAGVILMPGHLLRFETRYATVKQRVASGSLGRLLFMSARRNRPKWQGNIYKRTHILFELAVHDIDAMLWFAEDTVNSVRCFDRVVNTGQGMPADLSFAILNFTRGALGVIQATWLLPDSTAYLDDSMQIVGTAGIANVDILRSGLTLWSESGCEIPDVVYEPRMRGAALGALRDELSYFVNCAVEGKQPTIVTAEDGLESVRIIGSLIESADSGRDVSLAEHSRAAYSQPSCEQ
jgi:UDP-N-acetylglucosamine 3-dehydrogenase